MYAAPPGPQARQRRPTYSTVTQTADALTRVRDTNLIMADKIRVREADWKPLEPIVVVPGGSLSISHHHQHARRVPSTMSDSDRDGPSEAAIASKLRDTVIAIHKSGKDEDLTVKRVRARAEKELGLEDGFFKTNPKWKQKSQELIVDAVDKFCTDEPSPQPTPKKQAPKPRAKPAEKKAQPASDTTRGVKRKAAVPAKKAKKRAKTESEESEAELSEPPADISDAESEPPKKPARRSNKTVAEDSDDEAEAPKSTSKPSAGTDDDETKQPETKGDISDSDLSSVIDEAPAKKRKATAAKGKKEKAPAKPRAAPKAKAEDDPDAAEVKRLQGWLVKCGIRKVWARDPELSKCNTAKEKISVLKRWLKDVGMDGKYSNEKAAKIKEQREFAKDLEAIKEGELAWGKTNEDLQLEV
ncbi:transcriptional regulator [Pyrenophora seminiperda CCB06]|uniref:Transcriptional regulator n=1 Tax=Pyrenophora seminiperda CCB06 TaxID=1302712 RepID=A0A3M7LVZ8_9PLEO|nr:transcriptional regulator [Pyrenophora seminiperda CCB06]